MKKCPYCAEEIQDDARVCRFCRMDLTFPPPRPAVPGEPETSGKAIASLVCGLFSILFPAAVLAVVMGHWSRSEIRASGGRLKGAGMAMAGLILGYLGVSLIPILIIAAIAIPNLLRAKTAANEASAVASLRTLNTACVTYSTTYGEFPASLQSLGPGSPSTAAHAGMINSVFASGAKSGYLFSYAAGQRDSRGNVASYKIYADPVTAGTTGNRHFFTDQSGVIRVESDRPANEHSPPVS